MTVKLKCYNVVRREFVPGAFYGTTQYGNNRAEFRQEPVRVRERSIRGFKSKEQARRFSSLQTGVYNFFNPGHRLVSAETYRYFRLRAFASWETAVRV